MAKVFNPHLPPEYYQQLWVWKYQQNPFFSDVIPCAWVLEAGGNIVGNVGLIPVPIKLQSQLKTGYVVCDYVVEENYRTYGIKLETVVWRNNKIPFLFTTTANNNSYKIHLVYGAKELLLGRNSWLRIFSSENLIKHMFSHNLHLNSKYTAKIKLEKLLSLPFDLLLKMVETFRISKVADGSVHVAEISDFGIEFDRLWEDTCADYDIMIARNRSYLNWRYRDFPFKKPRIIAAYDDANRLRGFAVTQISEIDKIRTLNIRELFVKAGDLAAFNGLLDNIISFGHQVRIDMVLAPIFSSQIGYILQKHLFIRRTRKHSSYMFRNSNLVKPEILLDENRWYVSSGDPDMW
jgi:hypothetical protein